jgi:L-cysteine:1D-myo-inositol 2-amino-2-deoxy-alpha-D-glucopyranoside ligase
LSLRLFNTASRAVEDFTYEGTIRMYVCGVTPYDTTHVGHARTYLLFDVLARHLIHSGARIEYIQNITDVDESIIARAAELGESYEDLGNRYIGVYMDDIAKLGMIPAAAYPRATEAIPEIQEVIRRLLATDHAYRAGGSVYLRVSSTRDYGSLSRLDREQMLDIERAQDGATVDDPDKEDPLDILLWGGSREHEEPSWESPWGPGRPGWHVECSTLALKHLGKQVDIHGGGSDLVFPHHEAEIAQSEAVTGVRPFVRFWVHVEMARLDGHKMAKSRGNMVFVRDLLRRYSTDAVRLYLLGCHYRQPLEFDEEALKEAARDARKIAEAARAPATGKSAREPDPDVFEQRFRAALDDDLDTTQAVAAMRDLASEVAAAAGEGSYRARRALRSLASRLGLNLEPPQF